MPTPSNKNRPTSRATRLAISIRRATADDATELAQLGARTFREAFGDRNTPEDIALHIERTFTAEHLDSELRNPSAVTLMAFVEPEPAPIGYVKLATGPAPATVGGEYPIELARLYVERARYGTGAGNELMRSALDLAAKGRHDIIWLGVWERNPRAIAFYRRWGFEVVGSQIFRLGTDDQTDLVMVRRVNEHSRGEVSLSDRSVTSRSRGT